MPVPKLIRVLAALFLLMTMPASATTVTLSGTVTYRERMALPPDAWLRVNLVDLATASPVLGATANIPASGQVPIAFVLNLHSALDPARSYGLMAEISSGSRVLFRNSVPAPVIPGNEQPVAIIVEHAPRAAPADPRPHEESDESDGSDKPAEPDLPDPLPAPASELLDSVWTVTSIGGKPVSGNRPLTLSIAADHRAGGSGGCNNYFTEASIEGQSIGFGPAAATRMACAPEIMSQESAFFAALAAVASYEIDDQGLRLRDAAGVPLIGLVRETE